MTKRSGLWGFRGRMPVARATFVGCALFLAAPVLVSAARADGGAPRSASNEANAEVTSARAEMDATLARMTSTSRRTRDMLRDARRRGTKRQVSCLDEALSRADVAHRGAREQAGASLAAYGRGDLPYARAARARVVDLDAAQRLAARDGAACLPSSPAAENVAPGTVVRVTVDPNIAPER